MTMVKCDKECIYNENGECASATVERLCKDKPSVGINEDCISRQAVLEILKNNRYRFNISQEGNCEGKVLWSENLIKDDACKEIEQLSSVTLKEKTGWIPVSERLPEESKRYIVTTKYNDVMTDFYTGEGFLGDDIIAWMPLPDPFELQESEDKVGDTDE